MIRAQLTIPKPERRPDGLMHCKQTANWGESRTVTCGCTMQTKIHSHATIRKKREKRRQQSTYPFWRNLTHALSDTSRHRWASLLLLHLIAQDGHQFTSKPRPSPSRCQLGVTADPGLAYQQLPGPRGSESRTDCPAEIGRAHV